jgi:6-phosphogluconolactonase (cycloisomerase 2 family)
MYVLSRGARDVLAFRVDDDSGELTLQGRIPARSSPTSLVMIQGNLPVSRSTRYAYSVNEASDDISAFGVDPLTGVLSEIGLAALTGDQPSSVAVDPRGRFVYVGNANDGTISMFSVDAFTGQLFEIAPALSAGAATSEPVSVTVGRSGRFLYSANRGTDTLGVFTIDQATGVLFQIATLVVTDGLLNPEHVGVDPTGQILFVSASGDGTPGTSGVSIMNIDPRTGVPTRSTNPGLADGVTSVSFHPTGRFLYAVIESTDELATFEVNRNTGAMTEVLPRVTGGDLPSALTVDRSGRFAYAAIQDPAGTGHVSLFPIDAATGLLTTTTGQFFGGSRPVDLAVDATGSFLHVSNADSNDITTFRIDADTGLLAPPASTLTGLTPSAFAVSNAIQ